MKRFLLLIISASDSTDPDDMPTKRARLMTESDNDRQISSFSASPDNSQVQQIASSNVGALMSSGEKGT